MESARSKAELAGQAAAKAMADADRAKLVAKDVEYREKQDAIRGGVSTMHHCVDATRAFNSSVLTESKAEL